MIIVLIEKEAVSIIIDHKTQRIVNHHELHLQQNIWNLHLDLPACCGGIELSKQCILHLDYPFVSDLLYASQSNRCGSGRLEAIAKISGLP